MDGPRTRIDVPQHSSAVPIERQGHVVRDSLLFENAPVCLWHEDFSDVKCRLDYLAREGVKDFREYFENHDDVVAEIATLVRILDVNGAAVDLYGARSKGELTRSLTRTFDDSSYEVFREELVALAHGEMSFESDTIGRALDGKRLDLMLKLFVDPASPDWSSVYVALTDITERKETEQSLLQSEKRLREILDGLFGFVGLCSTDGILLEANRAPLEVLGLQKEDVIGKPLWDVYCWSYSPEVQTQLKEALQCAANGGTVRYDVPIRTSDDRFIEIDVTFGPILDSEGNVSQLLGFGVDITKRCQAIQAAKESESRLQTIVDTSFDFIMVLDLNDNLQYLNRTVEGMNVDEVIGTSAYDYVPETSHDKFKSALDHVKKTGESYLFESQAAGANCGLAWYLCRLGPQIVDGELKALTLCTIDITDRKEAEERTQNSESTLRAIIEAMPDMMFLLSRDGIHLDYYASREEELYARRETIVGASVVELLTWKTAQEYLQRIKRTLEKRSIEVFEYALDFPGNNQRHFEARMVPCGADSVLTLVRNISERKKTEAALRQSEERLDLAVRGTSDGIWDAWIGSAKEYWSPRFKELLGYAEDEIDATYEQFLALLHPDDKAGTFEAVRLHLEENHPYDHEYRMRTKGGEYRWFQSRGEALRDRNNRPYRMAGSLRDITDRKRADEKTARFNRVLENTLNEIYIFDAETLRFLEVNRGARQNLGYSMEELRDLTPLDLNPEFTFESFTELIEPVRKGELDLLQFSTVHRRRDGTLYPVDVYLQLVSGDTPVFVVIILDITERKLAEEEKRRLHDHLRHSQKMDAVGQLAAGVAHEFNNILVGILGNAELLLAEADDDLLKRFERPLRDIERAGTRAAELTKQLLSFARKKNPCVSLLDVNRVVTGGRAILKRLLGESIVLETTLSSEPALVRADEAEIEQAILNLVMNSRDAMPTGGTLTIRTDSIKLETGDVAPHCAPGHFVRLSVIDEGCGMPPEVVERIFEPFFTTKPVGEGTGLGLSTIFADLARCRGFVNVESRVGEGTVVSLLFPRAEGPVETTETGMDLKNRPTGGSETILVCDDEPVVLASVSALVRTLGYRVLCANSPQAAIESAIACDGQVSLLLTDVTMPKMDGLQLGKEITKIYPELRVILTSGFAEDVLLGRADKDEHVIFLQKPVRYDTLARTIRRCLDSNQVHKT